MKRKRGGEAAAETPTKSRTAAQHLAQENDDTEDEIAVHTPTKQTARRNARLDTPRGLKSASATPKSLRKVVLVTPSKAGEDNEGDEASPTLNADRSARRKSSRRLIERTFEDELDDGEMSDSDDEITRELLGNDDGEEEDVDDLASAPGTEAGAEAEAPAEEETPGKRRRGRPKGRSRKRSPTPPQNLPPHEQYFWQNRPGANKTSNNTLPSKALLNHDEYFQQMNKYEELHQDERDFLSSLHARSFPQWEFEHENGFNICLFGYGSKRHLLNDFATYLHGKLDSPPKTVVVNGYAPGITIRDILSTVASTLLPSHLQLPVQPPALLDVIAEALQTSPTNVLVLLNSIDALSLRRTQTQSILSRLASLPQISLIATADTLDFPLLWDTSLRSAFRFLFHDCTTFAPYTAELVDAVESVNSLLGRGGRRGIGGKDGVAFVLRSLPANARSLFRVLVAEQVTASLEDEGQSTAGAEQYDHDADDDNGGGGGGGGGAGRGAQDEGVEYRLLYRKACEELICTNENGFRTLLKEFFDHQMVDSRRDALGTERLVVPFRREELEALLEDLV